MFALLTIARKVVRGRPAPMRTFASVAANSTHITSVPKCSVQMNDYRLMKCPCVLQLQAAMNRVCALVDRMLCTCREGRHPWAKEALGILSREGVRHVGGGGPQVPPSPRVWTRSPPRGKSATAPASLAEGARVSCRGEEQEASSDEDEDGFQKPQLGAGLWGHGPPLAAQNAWQAQKFHRRAGLVLAGSLGASAEAVCKRMRIFRFC